MLWIFYGGAHEWNELKPFFFRLCFESVIPLLFWAEFYDPLSSTCCSPLMTSSHTWRRIGIKRRITTLFNISLCVFVCIIKSENNSSAGCRHCTNKEGENRVWARRVGKPSTLKRMKRAFLIMLIIHVGNISQYILLLYVFRRKEVWHNFTFHIRSFARVAWLSTTSEIKN